MDVRFSDTEMTADGKTINVFVDDVMSRVEIFRAAESAGHSGWSIVDCGDGDRTTVESDMALAAAKHRALEYLVELEGRGENLYFAPEDGAELDGEDGETESDGTAGDTDALKPYVDSEGQQRLFSPEQGVPMDAYYTDERHEKIVAKYEKSKAELAEDIERKKNLTAVIKMREANHHHDRIEKVIDDARCESLKKLGRGIVPIAHFSKMMTIVASDVHAYSYEETKFFQAFVNGMPVSLDEAIEADRIAKGVVKEIQAGETDTETTEREYRCARFERDTVTAIDHETAKSEMQCSPEDENAGCFGCEGPVAVESQGDTSGGENSDAGEDLPKLPDFEESDDVDVSDLPGFGDEGDDEDLLQERAG